ncbi:hypothetical protein sS8_0797 [Methylocaldum marinum]|uniref:Uncharacterized protein n=1 Tax=Methylocaldum marinum TaxID=1432792 RepID=A0A250KMI8_9GAMM|nr:hypothetical protein sS8_0797 [Methylocaldum marinum]
MQTKWVHQADEGQRIRGGLDPRKPAGQAGAPAMDFSRDQCAFQPAEALEQPRSFRVGAAQDATAAGRGGEFLHCLPWQAVWIVVSREWRYQDSER